MIKSEPLGENAQLLLDYWKSMCTASSIPAWADIKISAIAPIASRFLVYDLERQSGAYIRYAGEEVALRMQTEIMGGNTDNFVKPEEQKRLRTLALTAAKTPCAALSTFLYRGSPSEPIKRGLNFTLPVLNKSGEAHLLLMTDDWVEGPVDKKSLALAKKSTKKVGYITMIDDYVFVDIGYGLPVLKDV